MFSQEREININAESGKCPFCNSTNYTRDSLNPEEDIVTTTCWCNDCEKSFVETFSLTLQSWETNKPPKKKKGVKTFEIEAEVRSRKVFTINAKNKDDAIENLQEMNFTKVKDLDCTGEINFEDLDKKTDVIEVQ